jgi:hypothetical protein
VDSSIFAVEVNDRYVAVAEKEVCDLVKAGVTVLADIGWEARQVGVAMKRGERCDALIDRLGVCAGRRTVARTEEVPAPGIEDD